MELSEVRGAEENRVMKETMNEKDFIELMNKVKNWIRKDIVLQSIPSD